MQATPGFFILKVHNVTIDSVYMYENKSGAEGTMMDLKSIYHFTIKNSNFNHNTALQGLNNG